jgi:hypothetical protein
MTYKQNSIIRMIPITVAPKTIAAAVPSPFLSGGAGGCDVETHEGTAMVR